MGKKEFAIAALNAKHKNFVVYVVALSINSNDEKHPLKKAQIAYLKVDKAFHKIFRKYINFANIFLLILAIKLFKHMRINNHTINVINN